MFKHFHAEFKILVDKLLDYSLFVFCQKIENKALHFILTISMGDSSHAVRRQFAGKNKKRVFCSVIICYSLLKPVQ